MKRSIKAIIGILTCLLLITIISVDGYTYDYKGDPIHSPDGLVTTTPKYARHLNIDRSDFGSPEDLFVYKDANGESTIYIADSSSNKIFILDANFNRIGTIESVMMNPNRFTDDQLKAIKSNGNWVIGRDEPITIPFEMEEVYLSLEAPESMETDLKYELHSEYIPEGAKLEWKSDNIAVAKYEVTKNEAGEIASEKIIAVSEGKANIIGQLVVYIDEEDLENEDGTITKIPLDEPKRVIIDEISIIVVVTAEPEEVEKAGKNSGFTINEIRNLPMVELQFRSLSGIYRAVTPNVPNSDYLYISDVQNNQIYVVEYNEAEDYYEVVLFVTNPDDVSFEGKTFQPKEVVTDMAGRIYVIAHNVYEGIIQFSREGKFDRFTGVNYVKLSPWEIFWRNFSTEAQLAQQSLIINTSFTGMTVDENGFIYATSYAITNDDNLVTDDGNMIKKINPFGKDVLRRNGYHPPMGDVEYIAASNEQAIRGPSRLTGIAVNEYGMYTVVDLKIGRLFTYDREGNLLYVSGYGLIGGNPTQDHILSNPVAIAYLDENVIVLDKNKKALLVYEPSAIGKLINEAVKLEYVGDNIGAAEIWEEVVVQNANYEYAYIGIGRKYMALEDYETAMQYFEFGKDRQLYSRAFKMYRDARIRSYFAPVMGTLLVLIGVRAIYKAIKRRGVPKVEDTGIGDE